MLSVLIIIDVMPKIIVFLVMTMFYSNKSVQLQRISKI